ncbi:G5 domain-containing protein [Actinomyces sp. zg-332]|uniref:aggregation-promoting factor C-terminal-like domain-containing protein n=1 Tax=Actinomyces sp. zg-332 TaxID=2708340 RepID=UPI0014203FC8|nr:G5 domain-containing protein [Actinomyces sp. zg-332]QPK94289.1 G5 domain-containing protein [Actinomyces sp. zg-332]
MSNENNTVSKTRYPSRRDIRKHDKKRRLHKVFKASCISILTTSVLVLGIGTSLAYPHKTVRVTIDGKTQTVSTWAEKVSDVLREKGVFVKKQDDVSPNANAYLQTGDKVVVNEAKKVSVNVNGTNKEAWTTASYSDEIVDEFSDSDVKVTVSARSSNVNGSSNSGLVSKKSKIKVIHDGKDEYVDVKPSENAETVLKKIGVEVSPIDKVLVGKDKTETSLIVQRVERGYESKTEPIKFETKIEKDPQLEAGEQKKAQEGKDGEKEVSSYFEKVDGKVVHQGKVTEDVKSEPVEEVIKLGVKGIDASKLPDDPKKLLDLVRTGGVNVPNVNTNYSGEDPRALALPLVVGRGWSDSEYRCLIALWEKESHWNPNAYNASSGATGIPQALPGNKMASAGPDWRTNPVTQIRWGLGYISGRYGTPCKAWGHSQAVGWY